MTPPNQFMEMNTQMQMMTPQQIQGNMKPKRKKGLRYFSQDHFSYSDAIAAVFIILFVGVVIYAVIVKDEFLIKIIEILIPPVTIILGGYFGQNIASSYFMSKSTNGNMYNTGMYGTGYYDPYSTGMYSTGQYNPGMYTDPSVNMGVGLNINANLPIEQNQDNQTEQ